MFIISCNKDVPEDSFFTSGVTSSSKFNYAMVKSFTYQAIGKSDVTSRSSGSFEKNEAIELLEESLNFAYCRIDTVYDEFLLHKDTLKVEVVNDTISESDLLVLFDAISLRAGEYFYGLAKSTKDPHVFGLKLSPTVQNDSSEVYVQFVVRATGYECAIGAPYGLTDYWTWGDNQGQCNSMSGGEPCDAALIFSSDLTSELIETKTPLGRSFYFTAIEGSCFDRRKENVCDLGGMPFFIYDEYYGEHDFGANILFYALNDNCLSPTLMNHHYYTMIDSLIIAYTPQHKQPAVISVGYLLQADGDSHHSHGMGVFYGIKKYLEPADEAPIPLPVS